MVSAVLVRQCRRSMLAETLALAKTLLEVVELARSSSRLLLDLSGAMQRRVGIDEDVDQSMVEAGRMLADAVVDLDSRFQSCRLRLPIEKLAQALDELDQHVAYERVHEQDRLDRERRGACTTDGH